MRRFWRVMALALIATWVAVGAGFWVFQDRLLYHPRDRALEECDLPEGVAIIEIGGERGLFASAASRTLVVFYHGNGSDACNWRFLGVNHLGPLGYDTLVMEYPGYGGDPRAPDKPGLLAVADAARDWGAANFDRVVVIGYSLGTAPAAHHAGTGEVDHLMLFAPFGRMLDIFRRKGFAYPAFLLRDDYDNIAALEDYKGPVTAVYGARDTVIPPRHARALIDALEAGGAPVEAIERADLGHWGFFESPWFDELLARRLGRVAAE